MANETSIVHTFTDGMNMDTGTMFKKNDSVVDALNFTIIPNEENTGFQASNKRGNRFSFTFPGCNLNNQIDISFNPLESNCSEIQKWTYWFDIVIGTTRIPIKIDYRKGLNYSNYKQDIEDQVEAFFNMPGNENDELESNIKIFNRSSGLVVMYYGCVQGFFIDNNADAEINEGSSYKHPISYIKRNENVINFFHILGWEEFENKLYVITNNEGSNYFQIWKIDYDLYNNSAVVKADNDCGFLNPENLSERQLTYRDHLVYNGTLTYQGDYSKVNKLDQQHPIYNEIRFTREDDCYLRMIFTDNNNSVLHLNVDDPNIMAYEANNFRMNPRIEPAFPYLKSAQNYGGNLKAGSYQAFITYRDRLGNDIVVQTFSTLTPVYKYDSSDSFSKITGSEIDTDTTISLTYAISGLDNRYDKIGFGIIKYELENVPLAYMITELDINGQHTIEYTYTGFEEAEVYPLERLRYGSNPIDVAKTIESSKGNMIYANTKSGSVYNIDWTEFDVRAYRWRNKNGIIESYPIEYNGSVLVDTLNWSTIDQKADVVNPYNDHSGRNFDLSIPVTQATIETYHDDYQYKFKSDGVTLGGEGQWIDYEFVFEETEEDVINRKVGDKVDSLFFHDNDAYNTACIGGTNIRDFSVGAVVFTDSEIDYSDNNRDLLEPIIIGDSSDLITPPVNSSLINPSISNCCIKTSIIPLYKNQKDSLYVSHRRGFQNGEVYRFGIVAHSGSRNSSTQWIGDIKIPDIEDFRNINSLIDGISDSSTAFDILSPCVDEDRISALLKHTIIGIKFNIKDFQLLQTFIDKNEIDYFSIVYVERKDNDISNIGNGFANPLENSWDRDSNVQWATNRSLFTGSTTPKLFADTDYFRDNFTIDIPYLHFSTNSKSTGSDYISIDGEYRHKFYAGIERVYASYSYNQQFDDNLDSLKRNGIILENSGIGRVYYWEQTHQYPFTYTSIYNKELRSKCRYTVKSNTKESYGNNTTGIDRGGGFSYPYVNCMFGTGRGSSIVGSSNTSSKHRFMSIGAQTNLIKGINTSGIFNHSGNNWRVYLYGSNGFTFNPNGDCLGENEGFSNLNRYMVSYRRYLASQYNGPFYRNRVSQCYQSANSFIKPCRNSLNRAGYDYTKSSSISFSGDTYVGVYSYTKSEFNTGVDNTYYDKPDASYRGNKPFSECLNYKAVSGDGTPSYLLNVSYAATAPFNFHLRHGSFFNNKDLSKYNELLKIDEYKYNTAYSQKNNIIAYCTNPDAFEKCQEHNPFRVYYSDTKLTGESVDSHKLVRPLNYLDLNGSYGQIQKIISFNDKLYCFQERGVCMVELRPVSALQDTSNRTINIGTGDGIISQYITTESGTMHKWSVTKSGIAIYYFDVINRKIMQISGNGINPLSDTIGWSSFIKHNIQGLLREDNLLFGPTVHFFADKVRDTVYFTFINRREGDTYDCIYENEKPNDGPVDTPVDYSNVYNYTLSYLEKYQKGECFNSFMPYMYVRVNGLMLSIDPKAQQLDNSSDSVFIHNIGRYGQFYEYSFDKEEWDTTKIFPFYIRLISNNSIATQKVYDNLEFDMEVQEVISNGRYVNYGNTGTVDDVHNMESNDVSTFLPVEYDILETEYIEPFDTSIEPNDEHGKVVQCHLRFFNSYQSTQLQPLVYNHSVNPVVDLNATKMLYDRRERTWRVRIPRDIHNTRDLQHQNAIPIRYKPRMNDKWLGIEFMFDNNKYLYKQTKNFKHLDQKIVLYYIKVDFRVSNF